MVTKIIGRMAVLYLELALSVGRALAANESATELAKKTQNPVADLISFPFQNNFNSLSVLCSRSSCSASISPR
jgi:hypothetical protein